MARPSDNSLRYFNKDTKDDDNIQYVEAIHGLVGYAIVDKLWKHIFGCPNGYYCDWKELNQRLFCKNNGITIELLKDIMETCFINDIRIFSRDMYERHGILTSSGIQKRWLKIVTEAGRTNRYIMPEYCVLKESETTIGAGSSTPETTPPVDQVPQKNTESKENEIKETKNNKNGGVTPPARPGKRKERELPKTVEEIDEYISAKMKSRWDTGFISLQAHKIFNYYNANGWVQGRGKPIISWKHAVNNWLFNELDGRHGGNGIPLPPKTSEPIPEKPNAGNVSSPDISTPVILSEAEKEKTIKEFINDVFADYRNGNLSEKEIPFTIYKYLVQYKSLSLTDEEKNKIKAAAAGNDQESKRMAIVDHFNNLIETNQKSIF